MWAARVIVIAAEAQVALLVDVNLEGVPAGDYYPHADVKLTIHNQHRVLDIFLNHPGLFRVRLIVWHACWFMIHVILRIVGT